VGGVGGKVDARVNYGGVASQIGAMMSLNAFVHRPTNSMADGEALDMSMEKRRWQMGRMGLEGEQKGLQGCYWRSILYHPNSFLIFPCLSSMKQLFAPRRRYARY
jgi:hypothetical protein